MNKNLCTLCALAMVSSFCYAQDTNTEAKSNEPKTLQASMSLDIEGTEAAGFRGSDPESEDKHYLEDCNYKASENSLIYKGNGEKVASDTQLSGEPQINWTTTDDKGQPVSSEASNSATANSNFTCPGTYKVHNSGSRQLSDAAGAGSTGIGGTDEEVASDTAKEASGANDANNTNAANSPNNANGVATANQVIPVVVHDVTCPDVWIAFEEGAGSASVASTEEELEKKIMLKMAEKLGEPFVASKDDKELETTSYIFVDEGAERDKEPDSKTVRLTIAGNMFKDDGSTTLQTGDLATTILDEKDKTRQANINGGKDNQVFSGIYARRNVPFICLVRSIDNGDKRKTVGATEADGITVKITSSTGEEIQKDADGCYMFKVPNYPREEYADQPEYTFEAKVFDGSKNLTTVKAPLYIVNTSASIEGSTNR